MNTHSDYQPWQYNNGNGMLALKTPAILRPKIEKAKQNELFPLLSNERQLSTKIYLANQLVVIILSIYLDIHRIITEVLDWFFIQYKL